MEKTAQQIVMEVEVEEEAKQKEDVVCCEVGTRGGNRYHIAALNDICTDQR